MTQRDVFLTKLFDIAKDDKDVILIAPDMGAPSIDKWKAELPEQFFSVGISEQNAVNVASGFSSRGKKVYVYFMACWCCRCLEQIRYSCAIGQNPITILGCGVGLGYSPAGPAHNPTDDIAYMTSVCNIEIYSPATTYMVEQLVKYTYTHRKLVYVRLERTYDETLDIYYNHHTVPKATFNEGMVKTLDQGRDINIISSGYMLGRAVSIAKECRYSVIDLFRIKPLNTKRLIELVKDSTVIVNLQEQTANCGGFCASICQALAESPLNKTVLNIQLPESYIFENGNREFLLNKHGLSIEEIKLKIQQAFNQYY